MKLHAQASTQSNTVTGYGDDYIEINRVRHDGSVILAPEGPVRAWHAGAFENWRAEDLAVLLEGRPELVLIGTGARHRFLAPPLLRPLVDAGIGFETMDTAAACRTYNILMGEGRNVVAALHLPGTARARSEP